MDNSRTETEILYWCLATQYKHSKLKLAHGGQLDLNMDNSRTEIETLYWCLATQYKYSKLKYHLSDQRIRWRYSSKTSKTEATHWDPFMNFWWILAKIVESREARTFAHDEWPNLKLWISCSAHNPISLIPLKGGSLDADNSEAYNASTMTISQMQHGDI